MIEFSLGMPSWAHTMQVESLDARNYTLADAQAIGELLSEVWPNPSKSAEYRRQQLLSVGQNYSGPDAQAPRSFVIREDGRLIAHAAVVPRAIGTESGVMTIAGLAQVCVAPTQRGRGLGELVVKPVFALVDAGDFPFSLFQTSPEVRPFYAKLGACLVENDIINTLSEDLHVSPFWDKVVMRYPCSGSWPDGQIDLRGPGY